MEDEIRGVISVLNGLLTELQVKADKQVEAAVTEDVVLKPAEAAEYLKVSMSTLRRGMEAKEVPFFRVGVDSESGPPRFRKSSLDRYMENQEEVNYRK